MVYIVDYFLLTPKNVGRVTAGRFNKFNGNKVGAVTILITVSGCVYMSK